MNLSSLITRIKIDCGIYAIALPFDNADEIIKDIIIDITRPVFSKYCPTYEKIRFDLNYLIYSMIVNCYMSKM